MKNLIIVIHILLTVLLVGCADKGVFVGEEKDDKRHGKGTLNFYDGRKYVGEFKENEPWNITVYDKTGNLIEKVVNGEWIEQ
jgi:hypothetical protein